MLVTPLRDDPDALQYLERVLGLLVPGTHFERHGAAVLRHGEACVVLTPDVDFLVRACRASAARGSLCKEATALRECGEAGRAELTRQLGAPVINLGKCSVLPQRKGT